MSKSHAVLIPFIAMLFLFSGCTGMQMQTEANGKYRTLKSDTWIAINKEIVVAANQARVFLQKGKIIKAASLDLYSASCELKIKQLMPTSQTIMPGKYSILSTTAEESSIVFSPFISPQVYATNIHLAHTPADVKRFWRFKLNSPQAPKVVEMICRGIQNFPSDAQLPTLSEMQNSVGDYIQLHLM